MVQNTGSSSSSFDRSLVDINKQGNSYRWSLKNSDISGTANSEDDAYRQAEQAFRSNVSGGTTSSSSSSFGSGTQSS